MIPATAKRTPAIPALKTNPVRAILDTFGESITHLQSSGSVAGTNETLVEELRKYGDSRVTCTNVGHAYQHLGKANR
jgi:hypothetical protein